MSTRHRQQKANASEILDGIFDCVEFFEIELGAVPWNGNGRPRKYPAAMAMIYNAVVDHYGTFSMTDAELRDPTIWEGIRTRWENRWPTLPEACQELLPRTLPAEPYQSYNYKYARNTWLDDDMINRTMTALSVRAAREAGAFSGHDSLTDMDPSNILTGDSTTQTPIAGKGTKREDTDADHWPHGGVVDEAHTGDDLPSGIVMKYGVEHAIISLSIAGTGQLIVGTAPILKKGQEVPTAHRLLDEIIPAIQELPDTELRGFVYDKAVRGVDIDRIQRKHGIAVATAKSKGTEASSTVKSVPYDTWDGIQIRFEEGRPVAYELDINGTLVQTKDQPVRVQVKRRQNASGEWRFSVGYRYRGVTRWIRAWNKDSDHYSRAENFRILDRDTLRETGIGGYRSTAESVNRQLKRFQHDDRARSLGARSQRFDIMAHGMKNAALILWRIKASTGPPVTAQAA